MLTAEQRIALIDGAAALEYRANRLRDLADKVEEFRLADEFAANAKILRKMLVDDASNWIVEQVTGTPA